MVSSVAANPVLCTVSVETGGGIRRVEITTIAVQITSSPVEICRSCAALEDITTSSTVAYLIPLPYPLLVCSGRLREVA